MLGGERRTGQHQQMLKSRSCDSSVWNYVLPQRPRRVEILTQATRTLPTIELNAKKCEKSPRKQLVTSSLPVKTQQRNVEDEGSTAAAWLSLGVDSFSSLNSEKFDENEALLAVQYIQLLNAVFRFHLQSMDAAAAAGARSHRSYLEGQIQNEEYRLERSSVCFSETSGSRHNTDIMSRRAYAKYASKSTPNLSSDSSTLRRTHNSPDLDARPSTRRGERSGSRTDRPSAAKVDSSNRKHIQVFLPQVHTDSRTGSFHLPHDVSFELSECDDDSLVALDDDNVGVTSQFADDEASDVNARSTEEIFDSCETFRSKFHLPTIVERSEVTSASSSVLTSRCGISPSQDAHLFEFSLAPCNTFVRDSPEKDALLAKETTKKQTKDEKRERRSKKATTSRKDKHEQLYFVDSLQVVQRPSPRVGDLFSPPSAPCWSCITSIDVS